MRLTDKEFFIKHMNPLIKELEDISTLAEKEDFSTCRKLFAEYFRQSFRPEALSNQISTENEEELIKRADKACRHYMVSCGIPHDFEGKPVDWKFNPTSNGYREWTWQLNRHNEWKILASAYRVTRNIKYFEAFIELFRSWIEQAEAPLKGVTDDSTLCWRTLECGIRQGMCWPEVILAFYKEMSDDDLVDWCKSVWEHGERLYIEAEVSGNAFVTKLNGLIHISILYPFFRESEMWLAFSETRLERCLNMQIYPDGVQSELTTNYQFGVVKTFLTSMKLFKAYGIEIPYGMYYVIEKMLMFFVRFMRPDGLTMCINDGAFHNVRKILKRAEDYFPDNDVFNWVLGKSQKEPEKKSYIFEYPGLAVLRSGWGKEDTVVFFDGGVFGTGHQHEDKLTLTLYAGGKEVLCEGNNYAYDGSDMRSYVLSSYSHNTVLVDGMPQNRRRNFTWKTEDINKKSNLRYRLSHTVDAVSAIYDEGYGECGEKIAIHRRDVFFAKKIQSLEPFLIVVDRFDAEVEHHYEVMWHIDEPQIVVSDFDIHANTVDLTVSKREKETLGLELSFGKSFPQWQGWIADSTIQSDYRPIYNVSYIVKGATARFVTVIYPHKGKGFRIAKVKASDNVAETKITMTLNDGTQIEFDEKDYIS